MINRIRKLWDRALIAEAFRQTKWIAIFFAVLCGIGLVFSKITDFALTGDRVCFVFFIFAALLVFSLFGFLNRRAGSDFYHMLSKNRSTIYCSYGLMTFVWTAALMFTFYCLNYWVTWQTNHNIEFGAFMAEYVFYLAGAVLVIGATLLSVSITGNTMAGVIVMLAIVFVPRILFNNYIDSFYSLCPYLSQSDLFGKIVSSKYHILYDISDNLVNNPYASLESYENLDYYMSEAYNYTMVNEVVVGVVPILYSFILGMAYAVVGCVLFKKRMSETAGNSTLNGCIQLVLRIAVALAICLSPINLISMYFINSRTELNLWKVIIWYAVAICVWCLIELATTKSYKKVIRCLLQLPIVVLLNVVIVSAFVFGADYSSANVPSPEEVKSVKIVSDMYIDRSDVEAPYYEKLEEYQVLPKFISEQITLTSQEAIESLIEELSQEMKLYRINYDVYLTSQYQEYIAPVEIVIETENQIIRRLIHVRMDDAKSIYESMYKAASEIYDYEKPLTAYSRSQTIESGKNIKLFGYGISLGTKDRIRLYSGLNDDLNNSSLPLSAYMGYVYDRDDAFGYIMKEEESGKYYIPITTNLHNTLDCLMDFSDKEMNYEYFEHEERDTIKAARQIQLILYSEKDNKIETGVYTGEMMQSAEYDKELKQLNKFLTETSFHHPTVIGGNTLTVVFLRSGNYIGSTWRNLSDQEVEMIRKLKVMNESLVVEDIEVVNN